MKDPTKDKEAGSSNKNRGRLQTKIKDDLRISNHGRARDNRGVGDAAVDIEDGRVKHLKTRHLERRPCGSVVAALGKEIGLDHGEAMSQGKRRVLVETSGELG